MALATLLEYYNANITYLTRPSTPLATSGPIAALYSLLGSIQSALDSLPSYTSFQGVIQRVISSAFSVVRPLFHCVVRFLPKSQSNTYPRLLCQHTQ